MIPESVPAASLLLRTHQLTVAGPPSAASTAATAVAPNRWQLLCRSDADGVQFLVPSKFVKNTGDIARVHSQVCTLLFCFVVFTVNMRNNNSLQVDFIHCLVPDLKKITNCTFYWGKMDRYEAERLLEGKPEGNFIFA